ncbi:uncharacterized protein [Coffea arabica]|uniref:Uncharacterized protein LOC113742489 n=1 Tax=Coffea arabica TaxID=13443 RepID=A0A6P6XJ90_COFAR|nr:uncharacterized protein LOC113742489 [Coffea arabica]
MPNPIQPNGHLVKNTKPSPKVRPPSPSSCSCKRQSPSLLVHQLAVLLRAFEETNLAKDWVYICCTEILSETRMEKEVQQNAFSDEDQRIYEIIARDDGDEFQSALEGAVIVQYFGYIVKLQFGESEFCPFELLHWICYHRAARCGALLLERNDGLVIDLNVAKRDGIFPLHEAACSLSSSLVKLFLRHGAEANRRLHAIDSDKRELLPVQIALETLSCDNTLTEWKPNTKESVFDLIIMLCFPRLQDQLETVRLLVAHTELLDEIVCYYVLKGALIELAILLMANWEKVMGPVSCLCVDGSKVQVPLRHFIRSEMAALLDLEHYLMYRKGEEEKKLYELSKERKSAMLSTLPLLEVFEKAGDAIGKYVQSRDVNIQDEQVAEDVTRLFREAGFRPNSQGNRLVTMKSAKDAILEEQTESIEEKKDNLGIESRGETPLNPLFPKEDTSTRTDTDFRGNTFDLELLKMTPLITALEKLSTYKRLRQWTPQQSIFKLIIMLCLPEMKQVLETARLLELNQKDISEAACYFAMKGKIIELAILLMVAREKSLGPVCAYGFENHSSSETAITFRQFVRRELAGLLDLGFCLMGRKDPELVRLDDLCEEREQAMLPTLPLLDVFERGRCCY